MQNKELAQEILRRVAEEQKVREAQVAGKAKRTDYKKLDRKNSAWLKKVFTEYGWPTHTLIGKKAAEGMCLMIRHADHDLSFQKDALSLLKRAYKKNPKEVPLQEIAYITDRILSNEGKPLLFGTLYDTEGSTVTVRRIRDAKNVDKRRKEFGIKTTVEGRRRALSRELKRLGAK